MVSDNEDLRSELPTGYELNLFIGISEQEIQTEEKYYYLKKLIDESQAERMHYVPLFRTEKEKILKRGRAKSALKEIAPRLYRDDKDSKYDRDLSKLETERSAITTAMDSIKQVRNDNVERTFGIFS